MHTPLAKLRHCIASMEFAITLFIVIAIAAVIGTLLQQNQPYTDYLIKFGPFWHQIYQQLGLYDIYHSLWFLALLFVLVISTSVCVYRHLPQFLSSLRDFNTSILTTTLRTLPAQRQWQSSCAIDSLRRDLSVLLKRTGYRVKTHIAEKHVTIAAMHGSSNRFAYLATHIGVVIICVGGLIDGNLPLKFKQMLGTLQVEVRDIPVSEVPAASRLSASNSSFRASVGIPEGGASNVAFINMSDGYVVQELPFSVRLDDFRIQQYATGQPKSFESDLSIIDAGETSSTTISVNHPFSYKGYTFYQASFDDGGSQLDIKLASLRGAQLEQHKLTGIIGDAYPLNVNNETLQLELTQFKAFNVFPEQGKQRRFKDYGASVSFKLRDTDGVALEYLHYLSPVVLEDNYYFVSGVRDSISGTFSYLHVPVDLDFSMALFLKFQQALYDAAILDPVIQRVTQQMLSEAARAGTGHTDTLRAIGKLMQSFQQDGLDTIATHIEQNIALENKRHAAEIYVNLIRAILHSLFLDVLAAEGLAEHASSSEMEHFFDAAVTAFSVLHNYAAPFWLQVDSFEQRQLSGLQITKAPGAKLVYFGFFLLLCGVFLLFYVSYWKVWIRLTSQGQYTEVLIGGRAKRKDSTFMPAFVSLADAAEVLSERKD